jgi:uncharacterized protein
VNRLARETSPYLLQHANNPVDWRVWGEEALAEARDSGKPILLSVGYAACHWCHVMAAESFENAAIAAEINRLFIPIKLDREERPDLDAIYQHALAMMGQQGGWPLTMFLNDKAEPFWGGTYFPPEPRWGRPGFTQILHAAAAAYADGDGKIAGNIRTLAQGLAHMAEPRAGAGIAPELIGRSARRLLAGVDPAEGGFGGAPKFPQCSALMVLWRAWRRTGEPEMRDAVLLTLAKMSQGGIYDHLGGGYARYSTDGEWLVPHFEKMLYDNAQILSLLALAQEAAPDPLWQARAEETVAWLAREMRQPEDAFAAALDADSEHEEGKFYVWREPEIDALLGDESEFFKSHYDVTAEGNWEGKTILNRSRSPQWLDETGETRLAAARAKLLHARASRVRPGLDHKILADWNGLAIAALVQASHSFNRPDWREMAEAAYRFILSTMRASDGRLHHSWCGNRTHPGTLDDHVHMARAAVELAASTGELAYLDDACALIAVLDANFRADPAEAYCFAALDTPHLVVRLRHAQDGAVPSGNGAMVELLARLYGLTDDATWHARAEALIRALAGEVERSPFGAASLLNGADALREAEGGPRGGMFVCTGPECYVRKT